MSDYKENGSRYYQKKSIKHPSAGLVEFYELGEIVEIGGERVLHPSSDAAARTIGEAEEWITRHK